MLPENIINNNEINLTDDPGTQKLIGEWGEKQAERAEYFGHVCRNR